MVSRPLLVSKHFLFDVPMTGPWALDAPESFADGGSWYEVDWESLERQRLSEGRPTAAARHKLRHEKQRRAERQLKVHGCTSAENIWSLSFSSAQLAAKECASGMMMIECFRTS